MKNPIRIIIVEDSHFQREALRSLFANEPTIEVVGETGDGMEALALIQQCRPDVALLDISLGPGPDGFEVARELQQMNLGMKVVFLSGQDYSEELLREFVHQALIVGVAGFLVKSSSSAEIIDGIKSVAAGHHHFSSRLTPYLINVHDRAAALVRQHSGLDELTERERGVLILLSDAMTSREIAAKLHLSNRTVENHLSSIRQKLDLKRHHHLLKFAIEHKTELLVQQNYS
jgi:DNA-binding NarL/FixJ family response regulator